MTDKIKSTKKPAKKIVKSDMRETTKVAKKRKVRSDKGTKVSSPDLPPVVPTVPSSELTEDCKAVRELVFDLREVFQYVGIYALDYKGLRQFVTEKFDGNPNKAQALSAINAQAKSQGAEFVLLDLTSQGRGILAVHSDRPLALPASTHIKFDPSSDEIKIERMSFSTAVITLHFGPSYNAVESSEDW